MKVLGQCRIREQKGSQRHCEQQCDDRSCYPQPPFAMLDLSKVRSERFGTVVLKAARRLAVFHSHKPQVRPVSARTSSPFFRFVWSEPAGLPHGLEAPTLG